MDLSDDTVELEQLSGAWEGLDLSRYGADQKENGARYELSLRKEGETEESSGWVSVRPVSPLYAISRSRDAETERLRTDPVSIAVDTRRIDNFRKDRFTSLSRLCCEYRITVHCKRERRL